MKTLTTKKTYKLQKVRSTNFRPTEKSIWEGTLETLIDDFGYSLQIGNSHKPSIKLKPTTIKSLITALNNSYNIINRCNYTTEYVELLES